MKCNVPKAHNHVNKSYLLSFVLFNAPKYPKYENGDIITHPRVQACCVSLPQATIFTRIIKLVLDISKENSFGLQKPEFREEGTPNISLNIF